MATSTKSIRLGASRALALLFGCLSTERPYIADSGQWSESLLRLRDKYADQEGYNLILGDLTFSKKPGRRPYSPEVSKFLIRLQAGDVVQVLNPAYITLEFRANSQKKMFDHHASKVDKDALTIIQELAKELENDTQLTVPRSDKS